MRPRGIVLHLTASRWGDVAAVDRWHRERGFSGIGYHRLILNGCPVSGRPYDPAFDGVVQNGRPDAVAGAHCLAGGMNRHTLGVCCVGTPGAVPTGAEAADARFVRREYLTARQLEGLVDTLARLCLAYGWDPKGSFRHPGRDVAIAVITQHSDHDRAKPECASLELDALRDAVAGRLDTLRGATARGGRTIPEGALADAEFAAMPEDAEREELPSDLATGELARAIVTSSALRLAMQPTATAAGPDAAGRSAAARAGRVETEVDPIEAAIRSVTNDPEAIAVLQLEFAEAQRKLEAAERLSKPGLVVAIDDPWVSLLQSVLTAHASAQGRLESATPGAAERRVKFADGDLFGWAKSLFHMVFNKNPAPWLTAPEETEPMPDDARLAIMGDWGTGMYGALDCARTIQADTDYDVVMHLGDVYYSGTEDEIRERFLAHWPRLATARHRALNSNHEMYSGGHGYFRLTLPRFGQKASYFALQNAHWLFVGLDTAYVEHDIFGDQVAWLERRIAQSGNRRVVLFSHHQPFSVLETQGPKLVAKLSRLLDSGRIFAWYWGHEHRCVVYDQHRQWRMLGRCIGHSGMPYRRADAPPIANTHGRGSALWQWLSPRGVVPGGFLLDGPNPYIGEEDAEDFGPNGFLEIRLNGPSLVEILKDPKGETVYRRALS